MAMVTVQTHGYVNSKKEEERGCLTGYVGKSTLIKV